MTDLETRIKAEAKRLLDEKIVDVFIGFRREDAPLHPQPAFFSNSAELEDFVYNPLCQNNLAKFLTRYPHEAKIGMVVRGCENRAVNHLIVERQHPRENIFMLGVPCSGIYDWRKISQRCGEEIRKISLSPEKIRVTTAKEDFSFEPKELKHVSCLRCSQPNPVSADLLIGEPVEAVDPARAKRQVETFAGMEAKARYDWFTHEAERCIRCYACRAACPMCYCAECFVDHGAPRWTESMVSKAGMQTWHIIRAFHQSGRCVDCGACERACPMDIRMTYLTEKLNQDMQENYQFVCGMDDKTQPPFASFNMDDKARFVA
ncbi:MAG: 4Fe-4S binding protein [Anaerolineaceae bacterium]|nr:4Fe-4S binding protein [Anaerolineaceae bacterium]